MRRNGCMGGNRGVWMGLDGSGWIGGMVIGNDG
jgi:hypothetical protein